MLVGTRLPVFEDSYKAGADLRTHQFKAVEYSAENTVNLTNAVTDVFFGILQNDPNINEAAQVMHLGRSSAVCDGGTTAILVGDWLGPSATGTLVKKTTAGNSIGALALAATNVNGAIIPVMLIGPGGFVTLT